MGRLAIVVFGFIAVIGVLGAAAVVGAYVSLSRDLADPHDLGIAFTEESVIYDRTGQVELARFGQIRREVVTFDRIPGYAIDATTAVEDKTFWTNSGFDPAAILAAGLDTIRGDSRGASTITQQLVRQRLLDDALVQDPKRKAERKLKEIIQSIRLTQAFDGDTGKQQIITAYLNQNFYGNNLYGIKAAAKGYFGLDDLNELSLAQAAILAGIPQSPTHFDLVRNAVADDAGALIVPADSDIVVRRNFILDLMSQGRTPLSGDRFTAADFAAAKLERVVVTPQAAPRWIAPHFVWAVRDELTTTLCGESVTCPALERGGLRVTTTLNVELQKIAEKWVAAAAIVPNAKNPTQAAKDLGLKYETWMKNLRGKDVNNGALVALDYQTGELVAYVGSADYYAAKSTKQFQAKYDVLSAGYRQPGSAFKPFNYVTGIDDRSFTAASMFMDVVTDFGGGYTPTDADNLERGPVRVRNALQFSLNIPAVKALAVNKVDHVFDRARDFGMQFRSNTSTAGLSLTLGTVEVRPVDMVTAYGTLANGGSYIPHTTILRISDRDGRDVAPPHVPPDGKSVVSPQAAYIVTDILAGNTNPSVNPFWGRFAIAGEGGKGRRAATLKTGTNNDAKDLNAYGFIAPPSKADREAGAHALAVGAWNGNSDNSVVSTPNRPVFSIDVSTYVWQGFLNEAAKTWPAAKFNRPDGITERPIDPFTGLTPRAGGQSITELFIDGTGPESVADGPSACGAGLLRTTGFESRFDGWLAADEAWIARARRGIGVAGGPKGTRTSYFYAGSFRPWGSSWGAVVSSGEGCASPSPSASEEPSPSPSLCPDGLPPVEPSLCPSPEPSDELPSEDPVTPPPSPIVTPPPTPAPTPPPASVPPVSLPPASLPPSPSVVPAASGPPR